MATVTPTILSTTLYTVQNCTFLISDVRAAKKVEEFGFLTTNLLVSEDVLTLSGKIIKSATKKVLETAGTADKLTRLPVKKSLEVIGIGDKRNISAAKKVMESAGVVEKSAKSFAKKNAESFMIGEKASRSFNINKNEALAVGDVWRRAGRFYLPLAEGVFLGDKGVKELGKPVKEQVTLVSTAFKQAAVNKNENLTAAESFSRIAAFNVSPQESITVVPRTAKNIAVSHSELLSISSGLFKFFEALKKESAGVGDRFSGKSIFKRLFAEKITNSSKIFKTFNLSRNESIEVFDSYLRHANAVISDICLGSGEMTLEEFLSKTSSPPGYDRFIEFVVGEYEYRDALVRMVIEAGAAKAEPLIYDMAVNVDIDDTVDRGTAQITDTYRPTRISFNKHYYHAPEVGVTVKSGIGTSVITAEIVGIWEDGFDVSLYDSSRARVAGAITWTAVGY